MQLFRIVVSSLTTLALSLPSRAQTVENSALTQTPTPRKTMFKLGLRVNRGLEHRDLRGLFAPIALGVEQRLGSKFSVYGNLLANLRPLSFKRYYTAGTPFINRLGIELGGRYYYNQEKRLERGRAAGPFVGNYLALHASTDFTPLLRRYEARTYIPYDFSGLSALWGMQRRIGQSFLYDLNAGLGAFNSSTLYRYQYVNGVYNGYTSSRRISVAPMINLQISYVR